MLMGRANIANSQAAITAAATGAQPQTVGACSAGPAPLGQQAAEAPGMRACHGHASCSLCTPACQLLCGGILSRRPRPQGCPPAPLTRLSTPARPVKMVWLKMREPVKPQPRAPQAMLEMPMVVSSLLKSRRKGVSCWMAAAGADVGQGRRVASERVGGDLLQADAAAHQMLPSPPAGRNSPTSMHEPKQTRRKRPTSCSHNS